jgi:hypothetical protein
MSQAAFYELKTPQQWRAGYSGDGPNRRTLYFDYGRCGAKEAVIAGYIGTGPHWQQICVRKRPDTRFYDLAMFCVACWPIVSASPTSGREFLRT